MDKKVHRGASLLKIYNWFKQTHFFFISSPKSRKAEINDVDWLIDQSIAQIKFKKKFIHKSKNNFEVN